MSMKWMWKLLVKQIKFGGVFAERIFDLNVYIFHTTHTHTYTLYLFDTSIHVYKNFVCEKWKKCNSMKSEWRFHGGNKNNSNDKWCSLYSQTLNASAFKDILYFFSSPFILKRNAFNFFPAHFIYPRFNILAFNIFDAVYFVNINWLFVVVFFLSLFLAISIHSSVWLNIQFNE